MNWTVDKIPFPLDVETRSCWERLSKISLHPHPQQTWWWAECWIRHFAPAQTTLVAFRYGGETRALLPVAMLRQQDPHVPVAHHVLSTTGDGFTDTLPLLVADGDIEALEQVAGWLVSQMDQWDELRLAPLIEGEGAWPLREMLVTRGWVVDRIEGNPLLSLEEGWVGLQERLGRNLRHDVAKKKRRLEEAGIFSSLVLERACSEDLLFELEDLARMRNEHEGHKSVFLNPVRRAFIGEIGSVATSHGSFACFVGRSGQKLLGYRLGFLHEGVFFDWVTSYDPYFFPYSIGKMLLWDIVEQLCGLGVRQLDFMAGEEDYKLKWQPDVRGMFLCRYRRRSAANLARDLVRRASRAKAAWSS